MSVEAILMHFEAIFLKLILQALAVFQMLTTGFLSRHNQCINNYFDPSVDLIRSISDTDICCCLFHCFFGIFSVQYIQVWT